MTRVTVSESCLCVLLLTGFTVTETHCNIIIIAPLYIVVLLVQVYSLYT